MSDFEHKDDSGSLFTNKYREKDTHPTHTGSAKIVCPGCKKSTLFRIAAWVNEARSTGQKYFSFKFEEDRAKPTVPVGEEERFVDDDIPF